MQMQLRHHTTTVSTLDRFNSADQRFVYQPQEGLLFVAPRECKNIFFSQRVRRDNFFHAPAWPTPNTPPVLRSIVHPLHLHISAFHPHPDIFQRIATICFAKQMREMHAGWTRSWVRTWAPSGGRIKVWVGICGQCRETFSACVNAEPQCAPAGTCKQMTMNSISDGVL